LIAKGINIDVAFSAMIGFTYLYNWLGGRRPGAFSVRILFHCAAGFYAVVTDAPSGFVNYAFYLFGDLWSTVWVATFWALLNEISTSEQSARLYGLIGTGGLLGGIAGSALVTGTVKTYSSRPLILLCLGITAAIYIFSWRIDALARSRKSAMAYPEEPVRLEKVNWLSALDGAKMVARSRYLIAIVGILALYEFCSQIPRLPVFLRARQGHRWGKGCAGLPGAPLFGDQHFVSSCPRLFSRPCCCGGRVPGPASVVLPAAMCFASGGFWLEPTLVMGSLLIIADNGLNYSINQTSREMLFVPTSSDAQYKARAFTNMFIQRLAKGAAT
jgi:AAA family ATP:ADP antiporter